MNTATLLITGRNKLLCKHKGALFKYLIIFLSKGEFGVEGSKQAGPGGETVPSVWTGDFG